MARTPRFPIASFGGLYRQCRALIVLTAFLVNTFGPLPVQAGEIYLPQPGVRISLSPAFNPPILKGLKVHPDNPFRFDFILDPHKGEGIMIFYLAI